MYDKTHYNKKIKKIKKKQNPCDKYYRIYSKKDKEIKMCQHKTIN